MATTGRPNDLLFWKKPKNIQKVIDWAKSGITRIEIANLMNIAVSTLWRWMKDDEEFKEAIRHGMILADEKVIDELYRNSTGYYYPEEVAIKVRSSGYRKGKKWEKEDVVVKQVMRWHPADVPAQVFWSKNRRPEEWRDKQVIEQTVEQIPTLVFDDARTVEDADAPGSN